MVILVTLSLSYYCS